MREEKEMEEEEERENCAMDHYAVVNTRNASTPFIIITYRVWMISILYATLLIMLLSRRRKQFVGTMN